MPDLEVLKRQRSRPREWWAASPNNSAPPQRDAHKPKRQRRASNIAPSREGIKAAQKETTDGPVPAERANENNASRVGQKEKHVRLSTAPSEDPVSAEKSRKARNQNKDVLLRRGRSSENQEKTQIISEGGTKSHHRGRRRSQIERQIEMNDATQKEGSRKGFDELRRRGRSSHTETEVQAVHDEAAKPQNKPQKKDGLGSSKDRNPASSPPPSRKRVQDKKDERSEGRPDVTTPSTLRRGRSSQTATEVATIYERAIRPEFSVKHHGPGSAPTSSTQDSASLERVTRLSDEKVKKAKGVARERGRRRESGTVLEVETATSGLTRDRTKSKKQAHPIANSKPKNATEASSRQRRSKPDLQEVSLDGTSSKSHEKRVRRSSSSNVDPKKQKQRDRSTADAGNTDQTKKRKREKPDASANKRQKIDKPSQKQEAEVSEYEDPAAYQHLAAVTHRISRQTIEAKWEPLPPAAIERISQLLQDIQRPVVTRLGDDRKRTQVSTALQTVSRRLLRKISKGLPFPQGTQHNREDDFDFEKVLDHNRSLESLLTPVLHANALLEAELARETALLEVEESSLKELETNAKTEASLRKEAERKAHFLLQANSLAPEDKLMDNIGLRTGDNSAVAAIEVKSDQNLATILNELDGHVDSIQSNIGQVQGIAEAVTRSKAAVQATLFEHLERSEYEKVILG